MKQDVRHSQFILTLGPGAILESKNGPRLIPRPDIGLLGGNGETLGRLEIHERRISALLSSDGNTNGRRVRLFRLPSTSEEDQGSSLYRTREFPEWRLCTEHGVLFHRSTQCEECKKTPSATPSDYPIRFVMACSHGHMGDVPWDWAVHRKTGGRCEKNHSGSYRWEGGGRSFDRITITCPKCGASVKFSELYRELRKCPGIYPENIPLYGKNQYLRPDLSACKEDAQILQRQATNLHIPEIISLFSIDLITDIHSVLDDERIIAAYKTMRRYVPDPTIEQMRAFFEKHIQPEKYLNDEEYSRVLMSIANTRRYLDDIIRLHDNKAAADLRTMIQYEFDHLVATPDPASRKKHPDRSSSKSTFIINYNGEQSASIGMNRFRVIPVSRLRTVTVQRGYRRIGTNLNNRSNLVSVSFTDKKGDMWYPATEFFGEGIFLTFEDPWHEDDRAGPIWKTWMDVYKKQGTMYSSGLFRDGTNRDELHPHFVFWHTLSHALLRVLAVDSGYASASIRERVYCDPHVGRSRAGIILYTVQPGEGTMGGLISLVDRFEGVIRRAVAMMQTCPNDPLCSDRRFENGMTFGSSCYGCLQASETSCEHRNLWIDRGLVLEYFKKEW